jgi:tRNA1(Val) A37 N6-methylase TrmN6
MTLEEIKKWRAESTREEAAVSFVARLDRLIEIAEAAQNVTWAWQKYCDDHPEHNQGFEDHRTLYDLSESLRGK